MTPQQMESSDCRPPVPGADRGSSTVELVILTPVVIVLLLFLVGLGRYSYSKQLVQQAALAAARAASLAASPGDATNQAATAGQASLGSAGLACQSFDLVTDATNFTAGGTITIILTCTVDNSDAVLAGLPGTSTLTAASTVPLESYRQITGTGR